MTRSLEFPKLNSSEKTPLGLAIAIHTVPTLADESVALGPATPVVAIAY